MPPPAPKAKGKLGFLGKKVGPFSAWVWLVMLGGSVAVWYMLKRGSGSGGAPVELVTGSDTGGGAVTPQDAAGAGAPSQNGAPAAQMDPAVLEAITGLQSDIGGMAKAFGTATGGWEDAASQWGGLASEYSDALYGIYSSSDVAMGGNGAAAPTVAATLAGPGKAPGPREGAGVWWGGVLYGRGLGAEFVKDQLKPKGVNPQSWAQKHPAAATYLGIPKNAPKKAAPAKAAPRPQPKPKRQAAPKAPAKARPVVKAKVAAKPKKPAVKKKVVRR